MTGTSKLVLALRRRRVFRSAGLYIVGAWVLLQVIALAFQSFGIPDSAMRYVWTMAVAAFPLAMLLAWRYDISLDGIRRTRPSEAGDDSDLSLRPSDYVILAAVAAVSLAILWGALVEVGDSIDGTEGPWYVEGSDVERIVVMPLENLSGDSEQDYLADGLHDSLIATLSRLSRFRVTSRFSSTRLADDLELGEIRDRLGVDHLITGSIARERELVRVSLTLLDANTGNTLWNESYTREMSGLLDVQREVASAVARQVNFVLSPEEERKLVPGETPDAKTYEAYLKGMVQLRKGGPRGYRRAIDILTEAVEEAPTSALAYAGLSIAYAQLGHSPFPVAGAYPRARAAAEKAIEIDPTMGEAWLAMGMSRMYYEWDFDGAEQALLRALEINPSLVDAHYHYAWLLELWVRDDEAIAHGEYTVALNPLSPFYSSWLAEQYRDAGRFNEAIATAEMTAELNPRYPVTHLVLGQTYADLGRFDDAIEAHARLRDNRFWGYAYAVTLAVAGRKEDALEARASFGEDGSNAFTDTLLNAGLGDTERMIENLTRAREERIPWYPWLLSYFPQTAGYRDHPVVEQFAAEIDVPLEGTPVYASE